MTKTLCFLTTLLMSPALALAAETGEKESNVFAGTPVQSIAAVIVFLILFALLYRAAWGPILKGLQDRESKIKGDLERAEEAAEQAAETLKQYQASLAKAHEQAQQIIDKGHNDAQRVAEQIQEQVQTQINQMKQRAEQEIRAAKEQALAEVYTQTASLATAVAGKILLREVKPQDQQRLVEESIRELGKAERN
jgi:F-type H+-transporting ATPase subunit b